ncbi:MAG TPA: PAS domain S-box protein [Acidimicrobiales bacterium]|nr:PAS domain S-box protein [Acidimicrobiales bacterium]
MTVNGGDVSSRPRHGAALLERSETLEASPASPGRARRILRELLAEVERQQWLEAAELALSEVVTNAMLHAHSTIDVKLGVFEDEVCVEVHDRNPLLPFHRNYDAEATTGRGLNLVAALSRACGVKSLGAEGKIVWFCVGDPDTVAVGDNESGPARWTMDEGDSPTGSAADREILLASLPATLWLAARQHHDAILRELVLFLAEHPRPGIDLAAADARHLVSNAVVAAVDQAQREGRVQPAIPIDHPSPLPPVPPHLDLRVSIDPDAASSFAALQDLLDMAEALAIEGRLLLRPGLPEIVAVRDWACEQVIAQLAGAPAAPWPGTADERFETAINERLTAVQPEWDSSVVNEAAAAVIAADDANRIIAVSDPLLELLGWTRDELVGRRVVTVIPPSLREAHVAGFSRHLSTGEAHVLGVPLTLPVLRRSGDEISCRFLVERMPAVVGRTVYLAWIEPIGAAPSTDS